MESYSDHISIADSYSSNSSSHFLYQYQQEERSRKPPPAFRSALHAVRKLPAKNIITKKPIAPLPPTPPKIYKVDPEEFKDVVQRLTGAAPDLQQTRLQEVAPPPLNLCPPHHRPLEAVFVAGGGEEKPQKSVESSSVGGLSPLGFSLSPSSLAWCSAMLFSPGTVATLEPSAVL